MRKHEHVTSESLIMLPSPVSMRYSGAAGDVATVSEPVPASEAFLLSHQNKGERGREREQDQCAFVREWGRAPCFGCLQARESKTENDVVHTFWRGDQTNQARRRRLAERRPDPGGQVRKARHGYLVRKKQKKKGPSVPYLARALSCLTMPLAALLHCLCTACPSYCPSRALSPGMSLGSR